MKKLLLLVAVGFVLVASVANAQLTQHVSIDATTNILDDTTLQAGNTHKITFRIQNDSNITYNVTNGFRVFSPDGATWGTVDTLWENSFNSNFLQALINTFSVTGSGADTVGFAGISFSFPPQLGLPGVFNGVAMSITIGPTNIADTGKHICIDSAWYPPGGTWKWAPLVPSGSQQVIPTWSGQKCYRILQTLTDVPDIAKSGLPTEFALDQNYPNPFNPTTTIEFDVPKRANVRLSIYNLLGQEVTTMVDGPMAPGFYSMVWDGRSSAGAKVASGIYFYKLESEDFVQTRKMMVIK